VWALRKERTYALQLFEQLAAGTELMTSTNGSSSRLNGASVLLVCRAGNRRHFPQSRSSLARSYEPRTGKVQRIK
jgi:hypothetical protein